MCARRIWGCRDYVARMSAAICGTGLSPHVAALMRATRSVLTVLRQRQPERVSQILDLLRRQIPWVQPAQQQIQLRRLFRSEERRVGKECSSRWWREQSRK